MANRNKLAELLKARNPLSQQREAVKPVNLYSQVQETPKQESTLAPKHQDTIEPTQQPTKEEKHQSTKAPTQDSTKKLKHFSSYLTVESFKQIKRIALDTDKKDYEVIQEAVNQYLEAKRKGR